MSQSLPAICLGGQDLEMETIRQIVEPLAGLKVFDKKLAWGAKASDYTAEIKQAMKHHTPIALVELTLDIAGLDRHSNITIIDHHGDRAGHDQPSSLRQTWQWLNLHNMPFEWTHYHDLVSVNDIAHIDGMLNFGATADEIAQIRKADRNAQGIMHGDEEQSKRDLINGYQKGPVWVVETDLMTSSAIADFAHPIYINLPSPPNLLVFLPQTTSFYGEGRLIERLKSRPNCWFGGALPDKGFWGESTNAQPAKMRLEVLKLLNDT